MTVVYDTDILSLEDVQATELTRSFSLRTEVSEGDSIVISMTSPNGITSEQGSLVNIIFKISSKVDTGKTAYIRLKKASLRDEVADLIPVSQVTDGEITITSMGIDMKNKAATPRVFELSQNYPNPFNAETRICYQLPALCRVSLKIYNILGQEVRTLVDSFQQPGQYQVIWDGKDGRGNNVPSGVYLYRIMTGKFNALRKMVLVH